LSKKTGDYVFHPPSGSSVPGKIEANPYDFYPPDDLRKLLGTEKDAEEIKKIKSSLKKWERIYTYPGYLWRSAYNLRRIACEINKLAEIVGPAQNIPYYQDMEVPEGYEGILEWDSGKYDQDNEVRENIQRQGERPFRETEFGLGDFSSPKPPQIGVVKPRGDGVDPEGMDNPFPPTGGDIDGWPDML
jgi:hypothetical protein